MFTRIASTAWGEKKRLLFINIRALSNASDRAFIISLHNRGKTFHFLLSHVPITQIHLRSTMKMCVYNYTALFFFGARGERFSLINNFSFLRPEESFSIDFSIYAINLIQWCFYNERFEKYWLKIKLNCGDCWYTTNIYTRRST